MKISYDDHTQVGLALHVMGHATDHRILDGGSRGFNVEDATVKE